MYEKPLDFNRDLSGFLARHTQSRKRSRTAAAG
jgi:hypothetical protein